MVKVIKRVKNITNTLLIKLGGIFVIITGRVFKIYLELKRGFDFYPKITDELWTLEVNFTAPLINCRSVINIF